MPRSAKIGIFLMLFLCILILSAHGIGVHFSYFLPRNGWFSHPVPPLSLRNVGVDFGRYLGLDGSLTLYSIRGMGITDDEGRPIDTNGPLVGPFLSLLGSLQAKARIPLKTLEIEAGAGVFGCYNIDTPLITGNLDRYLATATATVYETVTSTASAAGHWGWGWVFGARATYYIMGQIGISLGANYYVGGSHLKMGGSYDAYDDDTSTYDSGLSLPAALQTARLDFSGLEITLGAEIEL
jgi:hypothetical protein